MTTLSIATQDVLRSLSWYMSARQTALRAALSFRTQLSVTDQTDMRIHYSSYFLYLLAATELFRQTTTLLPNKFEEQMNLRFVFDGFPDGKANFSYVRELRNAVIHRGLDITSAAHFVGSFPMILAEPKVTDQWKTKTFFAFDKYLLHVIAKCELIVGPVMLDCLNAAGIFEATLDAETAVSNLREEVEQSQAMPEHVKAMALLTEFKPEWLVDAHSSAMAKLRGALAPCDTINPSAS